jgi:hypothetical protein
MNWNNGNGLVCSGWRPWSSSSFHYRIDDEDHERGAIIAFYENLYPGPTACCLFSLPPLIIFAPCFCPLISLNSMAYRWRFYRAKDATLHCQIHTKTLFSSEHISLRNISSLEIVEENKAHTYRDTDGSTHSMSISIKSIILRHSHGTYEFPELTIDHTVLNFVHEVQALLLRDLHHSPVEASISSPFTIYAADCVVCCDPAPTHSYLELPTIVPTEQH